MTQDTISDRQWKWLERAKSFLDGKAYSSDNEDHDALFDQNLIEAHPPMQTDRYGAFVRVTDKGRLALADRQRSRAIPSDKGGEE